MIKLDYLKESKWLELFENPIMKEKINNINNKLEKEKELFEGHFEIFPREENILNCFKLCDLNKVSVFQEQDQVAFDLLFWMTNK